MPSSPASTIQIENKKLPRTKAKTKIDDKLGRTFRAYCSAYQSLNVVRPDSYTYDQGEGMMSIKLGQRVVVTASVRRVEQLTRMMRNKISDRG